MAYPPGGPNRPIRHQTLLQQPSVDRKTTFSDKLGEEVSPPPPPPPPPPENTYPCGCPYPGTHKQDCMWSLWEQMNENYLQTKMLMAKFTSQVEKVQMQDQASQCKCPSGCHGRDLGEALGMQQMRGVTTPWLQPTAGPPAGAHGTKYPQGEPDSRRMMEEQRRIKNTWAQFLNIFDMALDLANDVSKDRYEASRRRKERARLERQQQLEDKKQELRERQRSSTPADKEKYSEKPKKSISDKKETKKPEDKVEPKSSKASKQPEGNIDPKSSRASEKSGDNIKPKPSKASKQPEENIGPKSSKSSDNTVVLDDGEPAQEPTGVVKEDTEYPYPLQESEGTKEDTISPTNEETTEDSPPIENQET